MKHSPRLLHPPNRQASPRPSNLTPARQARKCACLCLCVLNMAKGQVPTVYASLPSTTKARARSRRSSIDGQQRSTTAHRPVPGKKPPPPCRATLSHYWLLSYPHTTQSLVRSKQTQAKTRPEHVHPLMVSLKSFFFLFPPLLPFHDPPHTPSSYHPLPPHLTTPQTLFYAHTTNRGSGGRETTALDYARNHGVNKMQVRRRKRFLLPFPPLPPSFFLLHPFPLFSITLILIGIEAMFFDHYVE